MAGALSRRDIEMIFRADTDKATRPIADLGKAVKTARGQLQDLVEDAGKSDKALERLGDTTRDLKKAQDELGTARSLLTQLNAQEAAVEKAGEKAQAAAKKYAELKAQVDGAEAPTKRLVNSMAAAERAASATAERFDQVQKEAAETRERIEGIIGPVTNVGESFRFIAATSAEISRGLAVAGAAADEFKAKINAAAADAAKADAKLNSDVNFEQAGRSAGLLQSQIDYISQFENRVDLLAQAKRELSQQDAAFEKALSAQEAKVGTANAAALERQIRETFEAADRATQIAGFQQIAADARAAVNDVARFGVAEDQAGAASERFATAISNLLNPLQATNRTMDGIESTVRDVEAVFDGSKKSAAEYGAAINDLQSVVAGLNRIARDIDGFRDQQQAVQRATATYEDARREALALAAALDEPGDNADQIAAKLKKAEAAVESSGRAMQAETARLLELQRALQGAGVETDDLAQAQQRLEAAAQGAARSQQAATDRAGGKGGLFGLNPQDATNLSYQINDIFTQLASGQSIFITLAQQGPQIWQIGGVQAYAKSLSGLLIPLAAVAGGLGLVAAAVYGVYKATSPDARTQQADAFLTSLGDSSDYSAAALGRAQKSLEDFGLKADQVREIVQQFVRDGLDPSYLEQYTSAVQDAATVTGGDAVAASKALSDALGGGYDAVVKLNEAYPVLTDAELDQVRAMYDAGKADEARQLIFDRFTEKYQAAADKMNGPWSAAWDNLTKAADGFGAAIANRVSPFLTGLRKRLDDAAVGANYLLLRLRGLDEQQAGIVATQYGGNAPAFRGNQRRGGVNAPTSTAAGRAAADDAEREANAKGKTAKAEDRILNARIKARRAGQEKGYGSADIARLERIAVGEEQEKIDAENARRSAAAARKSKAASDKAAREAEALANKIARQQESLQAALEAMGAKVAKVSAGTLQDQLTSAASAVQQQYAKLFRQLDEYAKLTKGKGKIGDLSIGQYRETLKANETILTNQAQLKVYEDQVNDTLAQRKQLLADIEDRAQRGEITNADRITQTAEVTSRFDPIIANLTQAAVAFARSIGGAEPSAELKAFLAKMQTLGQRNAGDDQQAVRAAGAAGLGQDEARLNQLLSARNSLVEQYNTLAELGLITQDEARRKSADAYNQSAEAIKAQIALTQQTLEAAKASMDPQAYQAMVEKLKLIGAQTQYLNPQFAQLKQGVDGIITNNAVAGLDRIAQALAGLATGGLSVGDALAEAGRALVDFIAQTLLMIGKLILQMFILDAVQKVTGIPVAALLALQSGTQGGPPGGGATGGLFGFLGKLFHSGTDSVGSYSGGQRTTSRISISPAAIAMAPRYHEGTPSVGLKSNEQVAVLETGEKVLTERQQELARQAEDRQAGGAGAIRNILAIGDSEVAAAMAGSEGEAVMLTHLRRNAPAVKQMLGNS